jgi:hypothetical protein
MYSLNFEDLYEYDAGASGITLPVELGFGGQRVRVLTKLDTGSTYCVFQRERGEELGLNIESGSQEEISTPMGSFTAYGHEVTLSALGFQLDVVAYFAAHLGLPRNVLGRFGWMQRLRVGVVDYEGKLYLGRYDVM